MAIRSQSWGSGDEQSSTRILGARKIPGKILTAKHKELTVGTNRQDQMPALLERDFSYYRSGRDLPARSDSRKIRKSLMNPGRAKF